MEIRWHGHAFFSLRTRDGKLVLIDPFFENERTRKHVGDFEPDLVLVTHAHKDHVGSATEFDAPLVATYELAELLVARGAREPVGVNTGGAATVAGVRVWCAPALHSSGFHDGQTWHAGGVACGFVVDDGRTRFYHAGDTGIFSDMRHVIRDLLQPHVGAVPIGDHYTMGIEHAARAVEWLGVNVAIPMHYDTFPQIRADPRAFERLVGAAARVVVPEPDGGVLMEGAKLVRVLPP